MSDPTLTQGQPVVDSSQMDPTQDIWHAVFNGTAPQAPAAWSAQSKVDPNTGAPAAKQANSASDAPSSYSDLWAQAPSGDAPARTWNDPSTSGSPQAQFQQAWYDSPVQSANPGDAERMPTATPAASPLTGLISALQAQPPVVERGDTVYGDKKTGDDWGQMAHDGGDGGVGGDGSSGGDSG